MASGEDLHQARICIRQGSASGEDLHQARNGVKCGGSWVRRNGIKTAQGPDSPTTDDDDDERGGPTNVSPMCGPSERISALEVDVAIGRTKQGKSDGPTEVVSEMLKAAGETGTMWMTDVCNAVVRDGKIPEDWSRSWMVNVYKGKGDALTCGSYRGIRLLEHAMKVLERVIEGRVRKIVKIDDMQFVFMAGRTKTDAIFIVRQLQEKYLARNKELWMAFVDLEKAFDRVPREVVWWALRYLGVDEWIVSVIRAMYEDATTKVKLNRRESKAFSVRVGVH